MPVIAHAPGRVNLIGEHTDYNGGFVMPCAIAYRTCVLARERSDSVVRATSIFGEVSFELPDLPQRRAENWTDYLRGILFELKGAGISLRGADLEIEGDVPIGAGLSSSASFEVATALAMLAVTGACLEARDVALLAQRAENEYTGTRCGIMDQIAVLYGRKGQAVFLDTRTLDAQLLDVPAGVAVVICDTTVKRELSKGAYNERRRQCEEAVAALSRRYPDVVQLRDVTLEQLQASQELLSPVLYRRALHVVTENVRVQEAAAALKCGDVARFGALMNASHASLRDNFEVSSPELDTLVEIAQSLPGLRGARMTGAGFGGCTVNIVDAAAANDFRACISEAYRQKTGVAPKIYDGTPSDGAGVAA